MYFSFSLLHCFIVYQVISLEKSLVCEPFLVLWFLLHEQHYTVLINNSILFLFHYSPSFLTKITLRQLNNLITYTTIINNISITYSIHSRFNPPCKSTNNPSPKNTQFLPSLTLSLFHPLLFSITYRFSSKEHLKSPHPTSSSLLLFVRILSGSAHFHSFHIPQNLIIFSILIKIIVIPN